LYNPEEKYHLHVNVKRGLMKIFILITGCLFMVWMKLVQGMVENELCKKDSSSLDSITITLTTVVEWKARLIRIPEVLWLLSFPQGKFLGSASK
jgi:hypothetical protein